MPCLGRGQTARLVLVDGLIIRLSQEAKPEWMICIRLRSEIVDPRLAPIRRSARIALTVHSGIVTGRGDETDLGP